MRTLNIKSCLEAAGARACRRALLVLLLLDRCDDMWTDSSNSSHVAAARGAEVPPSTVLLGTGAVLGGHLWSA